MGDNIVFDHLDKGACVGIFYLELQGRRAHNLLEQEVLGRGYRAIR